MGILISRNALEKILRFLRPTLKYFSENFLVLVFKTKSEALFVEFGRRAFSGDFSEMHDVSIHFSILGIVREQASF